jgi:hypothetical protein
MVFWARKRTSGNLSVRSVRNLGGIKAKKGEPALATILVGCAQFEAGIAIYRRLIRAKDRSGNPAYGAVGSVGRLASAIKPVEIASDVTLTRDSSGFIGTGGPAGHPISRVR